MLEKMMTLFLAYLLGSIPFGYLLVRYWFAPGRDIRDVGSGATGATNVTRLAGLKGGAFTFFLDIGKGMLAVSIAGWASHFDLKWMGAAAIVVILGHMFPVWIGFRGGKGVATGLGVYLLLSPYAALSTLGLWAVTLYIKRYVALASIIAAGAMPFWLWLWDRKIFPRPDEEFATLLVVTIVSSLLIIAKHHENIQRLLSGTEDKISEKTEEDIRHQIE
jgi:glycerol-3-phosphate acyltransferase PlsY